MKISKETRAILSNFASMNKGIKFRQGSVIRTTTTGKTVFAKATVAENFPMEVAVFDLDKLLRSMDMVDDPVVDFGERAVSVKPGSGVGATVRFTYANENTIISPKDKDIVLPDTAVSFALSAALFDKARQACSILGVPHIVIAGEDGKVYVRATDADNKTANLFNVEVGETDATFAFVFKEANLPLLSLDYDVAISEKRIAHLKAKSGAVEYWVPAEQNSAFSR